MQNNTFISRYILFSSRYKRLIAWFLVPVFAFLGYFLKDKSDVLWSIFSSTVEQPRWFQNLTNILSVVSAVFTIGAVFAGWMGGNRLEKIIPAFKNALLDMQFIITWENPPDRGMQLRGLKINRMTAAYASTRSVSIENIIFRLVAATLLVTSVYFIFKYVIAFDFSDIVFDAIYFILAISMLTILAKSWTVVQEQRETLKFSKEMIYSITDAAALGHANFSAPRVAKRAMLIKNNVQDLPSLHELLPSAASIDGGQLETSYTPLVVYAWLLPVTGFIGTALGMARAIHGFNDDMGHQQNVAAGSIDHLLQVVSEGLSLSFDTTTVALCATAAVYVCTRVLKQLDQAILDQLENACLYIVSIIPLPGEPSSQPQLISIISKLETISEQLKHMAQLLPLDVANVKKQVADAMSDLERAVVSAVEPVQNTTKRLSTAVDEFARMPSDIAYVERQAGHAISRLQSAAKSAAKSVEKTTKGLSDAAEQYENAARKMPQGITARFAPMWHWGHRRS